MFIIIKSIHINNFYLNVLTQPFAAPRRSSSASSVSRRPSSAISTTHNNNVNNNTNSVRPSSFVSSTAAAAAAANQADILNRLGGGNSGVGSGTMITISNLNLDILPRSDVTYQPLR